MGMDYDKHLEIKNKWQNQKISKYFKNKQTVRWKDRHWNINKIDELDMIDYEASIKYNVMPIWDCPRCTYKNIERKSYCNVCNISYSSIIQNVSNPSPSSYSSTT